MNLFKDIPLRNETLFNAIVEIPKASRVKYEYDDHLGVIAVDRIFKTPVSYPQNYGFFPRAWNKYDHDPMDVIILSREAFVPGALVGVRIIGIIEMDDTGELDHKIIAVCDGEADYKGIEDITDPKVSEDIANLEWFLGNYKGREKGKKVTVLGIKGRADALKFLEECEAEYQTNHA